MFLIRRQKKLFLILPKCKCVPATDNGCKQKHLLSFSEKRKKKQQFTILIVRRKLSYTDLKHDNPAEQFEYLIFQSFVKFYPTTLNYPEDNLTGTEFKCCTLHPALCKRVLKVAMGLHSPAVMLAGIISIYSIISALKSVFYKASHHSAIPLLISTAVYKIHFPSRPCQAAYVHSKEQYQ